MNRFIHTARAGRHPAAVGKLILVRHGESIWNRENRFAGWVDVDLSPRGIDQARAVGQQLASDGLTFHVAFCSVLNRAIRTLWHIQDVMDLMYVPATFSWRLNERHYGALSGQGKDEMSRIYGAKQVAMWRRGFDVRPPVASQELQAQLRRDRRYADIPCADLPESESLRDTLERAKTSWHEEIRPQILNGRTVLVSSHGNWIRMLIKHLDAVSEDCLAQIEVSNATPIVYDFSVQSAALAR
jgi:2,3-bisphosphoglycerate-dependent phosphoglycerate mutase